MPRNRYNPKLKQKRSAQSNTGQNPAAATAVAIAHKRALNLVLRKEKRLYDLTQARVAVQEKLKESQRLESQMLDASNIKNPTANNHDGCSHSPDNHGFSFSPSPDHLLDNNMPFLALDN